MEIKIRMADALCPILVYLASADYNMYTGWGKRRFTVVGTENNTIINK